MIQLYGQFTDFGSFANVSRAIAHALVRQHFDVTVHEIGSAFPTYRDVRAPVDFCGEAPVGIYIGYPPPSIGWLKNHAYRVLVTVCESRPVPFDWVEAANLAHLVVVPSVFCKGVYEQSGVTKPILVVPHGVAAPFLAPSDHKPRRSTHIRLLHVSGAASYPQRKGTPQLLLALKRLAQRHPKVQLYLKIANRPNIRDAIETAKVGQYVTFLANGTLSPPRMRELLQHVDAVVQPSRGEGFGIVPLEARCAGVPVALTASTGHGQHFVDKVDVPVYIEEAWGSLATTGNEIGSCPIVTVGAVEDALERLLTDLPGHRERTRAWAAKHAAEWAWDRVLKPLTAALVQVSQRPMENDAR